MKHPDYLSGRMDRVLLRFPNITRAIIAVLRHADTHKVFGEMAVPSDGSTPIRDLPVDEKFKALRSMDGVEVILYELLQCL